MAGWLYVFFIAGSLIAFAVLTLRFSVRRWWDALIIAALGVASARPLYLLVAGDLSRHVPYLWSAGADGKDQIIIASIAVTLLLPLVCAALAWLIVQNVWRSIRRS